MGMVVYGPKMVNLLRVLHRALIEAKDVYVKDFRAPGDLVSMSEPTIALCLMEDILIESDSQRLVLANSESS